MVENNKNSDLFFGNLGLMLNGYRMIKPEAWQEASKELLAKKIEGMKNRMPDFAANMGARLISRKLIEHLKDSDGGLNVLSILVYAGGLAGYACQAAARKKESPEHIETKKSFFNMNDWGRENKYYSGDALDYYLFGNDKSVCKRIITFLKDSEKELYISSLVAKNDYFLKDKNYKICQKYPPEMIFKRIENLWRIFFPEVNKYCSTSEEWPMLYGSVLLEILKELSPKFPIESCTNFSLESALYISRIKQEEIY